MAEKSKTTKSRKIASEINQAAAVENTFGESSKKNLIKNKKVLAGVGLAGLLLIILAFLFKGLLVVALVNGSPVTRAAVIKELENQNGKAILDNLVLKKLILQEADRRNTEVNQAEIDAEIKKIEESLKTQGSTLDQALELQGLSRNQLYEEIRIQLSLQKMVGNSLATEKQIDDYIEQNRAQFAEGTTEVEMRQQAKLSVEQELTQTKTQEFIKELQDSANIRYFVEY